MAGVAVGVDVGGTKLAAGLVADDGSVLDRVRHDTPDSGPGIVDLIVAVAEEFQTRHNLSAVPVGVGAAGLLDTEGTMRFAPNLPVADFPLGRELRARLEGPVTVDNDANVAAWAEYRMGAGRDAHRSLVMLTVGTGVGGGLVLEDRLLRGANGMGGELGHIVVLDGGPVCGCGARGCLEAMASGTAIGRIAAERLADGRIPGDSALGQLGPGRLNGKEVTVAAYAGDQDAVEVLAIAGRWLGVGIASLIAAFDPEIVVVGGGAMQARELLLAPARAACEERVVGRGYRTLPPIVEAALSDDSGLVGAALLALGAQPWF